MSNSLRMSDSMELRMESVSTLKSINNGLPVRLIIPSLSVDAAVSYVGVTSSGNMEAPANINDVGWYKMGAIPGNKGSAVMAGHVNGKKGEPGIFRNLDKLKRGDHITTIDSSGRKIHFTVKSARTYQYNERPDVIFNSKAGSHLNLITCTGEWDKSSRQYSERLVVFADKR